MSFRIYIGPVLCSTKEQARERVRLLLDHAPWGRFDSEVLARALVDGHPSYGPGHRPLFFAKAVARPSNGLSFEANIGRDPWGDPARVHIPIDALDRRTMPPVDGERDQAPRYRILSYPGVYSASSEPARRGELGFNEQGRYIVVSVNRLFVESSPEAAIAAYFRKERGYTNHACASCHGVSPFRALSHLCDGCGEQVASMSVEWDHHPERHIDIIRRLVMPLLSTEDIALVGTHGAPGKLRSDHPAAVAYNKAAHVRPLCKACHRRVTDAQRAEGAA